MLNINLNEINMEAMTKKEIKELLINIFSEMKYSGALNEIIGGRNPLKNAHYIINHYYNDALSKRYNPETMEVVWTPSEERIKDIETLRSTLLQFANYSLSDNTDTESEYLKLKRDYANCMFEIAQLLKTGVNEISRKRVNFYKELLTSMDYQIAQKEVVTLLDMIELIDVNKSNDFQEKLFKAAETRDNIWNRIKSKYFKN